jgi:hypothetical protein
MQVGKDQQTLVSYISKQRLRLHLMIRHDAERRNIRKTVLPGIKRGIPG